MQQRRERRASNRPGKRLETHLLLLQWHLPLTSCTQSSNEAESLQKLLHLMLHQKHRQDQNQKQNLPEYSVVPEAPGIADPSVVAGASFIAGAPVVTYSF